MKTLPNDPRRVLGEGRFARLVAQHGWEWIERLGSRGAVVIVPITDAGEVVLVEQYRIPLAGRVIELPAGLVGDLPESLNEDFLDAARRELVEETGFEARSFELLTEGASSAGLASEIFALLLATELQRIGPGGGDHSEDILVHVVPMTEVHEWLESRRGNGTMIDPKIYAGLYFAHRRRDAHPLA